MSLFIGNLSRRAQQSDYEEAFSKIGKCKYQHRGKFSFVEYEREEDAKEAKDQLTGKNFGGQPISIEWSKKSGKYDPQERQKNIKSQTPYGRGRRNYNRYDSRDNDRYKRRYRRSPSYEQKHRRRRQSRSRSSSQRRNQSRSSSRRHHNQRNKYHKSREQKQSKSYSSHERRSKSKN